MRGLLRLVLGWLAVLSLLLLLGLSAVRFKLLTKEFWLGSLDAAGVYQELEKGLAGLAGQMAGDKGDIEQMRALYNSGQLSPAERAKVGQLLEMVDFFASLQQTITKEKAQTILEVNLDRIFVFIKGGETELSLFLPVRELGVPAIFLQQPPLSQVGANGDIRATTLLSSFMPAEQVEPILDQVQMVVGYLSWVWWGLLVLTILLLSGHFFLGRDWPGRIKGTSWLLIGAGLLLVTVAVGVKQVILQLESVEGYPPVMIKIMDELTSRFFSLGQMVGVVIGLLGVTGVVATIWLVKTGKLAAAGVEVKEKKPGKKKWLIIGAVIGGALLVGLLSLGNLKVEVGREKRVTQELKLIGPYDSRLGWTMKYPQGWEINRQEELSLVGFNKSAVKEANKRNWAFLAVEPNQLGREVDMAVFARALTEVIESGEMGKRFPNPELVSEPQIGSAEGMKGVAVIFDHDHEQDPSLRIRQIRRYIYPVGDLNGFMLYAQTPTESWERYGGILQEAMDTFSLE